ncbi:MAG: hypothetical protein AB8G11_03865 [Saprospiraceae bacterium]
MLSIKKISKVYFSVLLLTFSCLFVSATQNFAPTNVIDIVMIDRSEVTMDIQIGGVVTIQLMNENDEVVYSTILNNASEHTIDTSTFPVGDYILSASWGGEVDNENITLK